MAINMSAGQTMMGPNCLKALSSQMETPIYYPRYWELEEETAAYMKKVIGTEQEILFLSGCATFGEEAALRSILDPGDKVIVVNAGVFGEVAKDLIEIVGGHPVEVKVPYGEPLELEKVENVLRTEKIKAIFIVHQETSTGTIYPLTDLTSIARKHEALVFVDAISTAGGIEFQMDEWGVDVVMTSPQKCLCAPQGIAMVALSERAWQAVNQKKTANNSLCLDLNVWKRYREKKVRAMNEAWKKGEREPEIKGRSVHEPTPSGPLMMGLHGSLVEYFKEGLDNIYRRNFISGQAVREAAKAMGLQVVACEENASPLVTVIYLPPGIYEKDFREKMLHNWGVAVGNGEIGDDNIRIGTMGLTAQPCFVLPAVAALEAALQSFNIDVAAGKGVGAAQAVFASEPEVAWINAF